MKRVIKKLEIEKIIVLMKRLLQKKHGTSLLQYNKNSIHNDTLENQYEFNDSKIMEI